MENKPSVLFICCSGTHPDDIIKLFLNVETLPHKIKITDEINAYEWHIDNKYYEADVNLCSVTEKVLGNKNFADTVQAVILHFDSSKGNEMTKVETWLPFINEYMPEIKILLCKNIPTESEHCTKRGIQEWCIGKGFELVELEPIIDKDSSDLEDDFPETTGISRIKQALNAHVWPNLVMKSKSNGNSPKTMDNICNELHSLREELKFEESLEELLENEDNFSQLFSQLSDMKARVSSLSGADRKDAAEQVVKAFWKAMGGDSSEFSDI